MTDLVSVIIPVYNVAPYLQQCIESVCTQTYLNIEILLIDDGSTDGSGALCDALAETDNRIKVYHQENAGLSQARNKGIEVSVGKYVYFIDSDDFLLDERTIETMVSYAYTYEVPLILGAYKEFDGSCYISTLDTKILLRQVLSSEQLLEYMYGFEHFRSSFIVAHNKLYERRLFENCLFPVGKLHEDEFTTYKVYLEAGKALWLNQETYAYRIRLDSISQSYSLRRLDIIKAYEERVKVLEAYGLPTAKTIEVLLSHLSYHRWMLSQYGYQKEGKDLYDRFRSYYLQYGHLYVGKQKLKLLMMRYANSMYRWIKHSLYPFWKRS